MVGVCVSIWVVVWTGRPVNMPVDRPRVHPRLTPLYSHGFDDWNDDPYEVMSMMSSRSHQVELDQGYHKRAYVYVGELAVLTTFDTGSFRNAIRVSFLEELEAK